MDDERKGKIAKQMKLLLALKFKRDDTIPAEFLPGIYIGSIGAALNKSLLLENQVTHILTVADNLPPSYPESFEYKNLDVRDDISCNILGVFQEAIEFIDQSLDLGGKVLVHCFAGKSRSAAICCAYLIKKQNMNLEQALSHLKDARPCIMPNPGFLFQLQLFEKSSFNLDLVLDTKEN